MTTLLITLALAPQTDPVQYDYVLSGDGRTVDRHATGTAGQLPSAGAGLETVAVVPARALSWHQVTLPVGTLAQGWLAQRSAPRLRAVLEGLLEDQLLDDPAQLHFALPPDARDGAPVWVAVCLRRWLQDALLALQQAGHAPHRVVPEWTPTTPLPDTQEPAAPAVRWLTGQEDNAQLAWADTQGVHLWPLQRHQGGTGSLVHPLSALVPAGAEVRAEPAVAQWAEQLLHRSVQVVPQAQRLLEAAHSDWDLAQLELARRNPWLARLAVAGATVWSAPHWRPARWAAAGLVLVQVLGLNAFAWHARGQLDQQRSAIRSTLTATFPQTTVVVDAPLQMQRAVAALQQSSGHASARDLETLLHIYGAFSPPARENTALTAMDFVAGELRLSGTGYAPAQAAALDTAAQAHGVGARLEGNALVLQARATP